MVRSSSVGLHLFRLILVHGHTIVRCLIFYPYFLACIKVELLTHCIMSVYVLFFCQYWARCFMMCYTISSNYWYCLHSLSLSVCNISVACYLFVMPHRVLLSFDFQFLLSDLLSTAIRTCLFRLKLSIHTSNTLTMRTLRSIF